MKYKTALISIVVLLLISAFAQNPKPAGSSVSRPLLALPLPEGRTLDEGHDAGFIDWSGSVEYVNLTHKDGICPSPCVEQVTRIYGGSSVSGSFAPVDVAYFEVMVAFTHNSGAGTAVLIACGSSVVWNLDIGPGSGLPGFVSMSIPVPAGCASWSLSASGGYVDFRSVDANYVSPPPPVATHTFTPVPTTTFTPSPTETETATPTATETLAPGVTPSDTPTPTNTPSPISTALSTSTLTSTPSATLPPGVTPSDTPVPSNTPIPPAPTNTPVQPPPSNGGQGGSGGFVLPTGTFTPTLLQTTLAPNTSNLTPDTSLLTPNLLETARVMIFGTSTPTPTPRPIGRAGKVGSGFPWWLLLAGGAAAYTASKRKQIAQGISNYRMKIRENKKKALEAQWETETKRQQEATVQTARNQAVEAKLARMEAEEGQQWQQAHAPKPVTFLSKFPTHAFSRKPKPAGLSQSKPWWQRAEAKITHGLITLGQKSPFAKRVLLTAAAGWFRYGQPIVNGAADFIGGFATQTVQNNLDAFATVAPMPPKVRQNYNNAWENLHNGRSLWYQVGRFTASLVGIAQGVWEMASGVATASGGTVVSCGTVVLCFAGGGAAVAAGSAVAAHGALVTSASIINTVRNGQALYASAKSAATASNAQKLERNITKATGQVKPAGYEAHHIVPSGSSYKSAVEARTILKKLGIDINEAGNGVFLPDYVHDGLANNHRYMNAVLEDLKKATSRDEAIEILQRIGQQLLDGTYPR